MLLFSLFVCLYFIFDRFVHAINVLPREDFYMVKISHFKTSALR